MKIEIDSSGNVLFVGNFERLTNAIVFRRFGLDFGYCGRRAN
jgi:hypothetical protein